MTSLLKKSDVSEVSVGEGDKKSLKLSVTFFDFSKYVFDSKNKVTFKLFEQYYLNLDTTRRKKGVTNVHVTSFMNDP